MTLSHSSESIPPSLPPLDVIFGKTPAMLTARNMLERIAATNVPVLFQGESGTGKELCVRTLHSLSRQSGGALVKVSCAAMPRSLAETELFGYEKGAFPEAAASRSGRVEQAHLGTLFLDEIGSLDRSAQSKLLQVLQEGTLVRVGGHEPRPVTARLVSSAEGDLQRQVEEGSFRPDFLFCINAVTINLPPLRQRIGDLPMLIDYFMERYSRAFHRVPEPLSRSAARMMQSYHWPGNIRQLENLIQSYVLIGSEEALVAELTPEAPRSSTAEIDVNAPISLKEITRSATRDLERQIIYKVLQANRWNRQKTAKWLHISYRSLLYKLNEIDMPEVPARPLKVPRAILGEETPPTSSATANY